MTALSALALLTAFGLACAAAGAALAALWLHRRQAPRLRAARRLLAQQAELAEHWQWETDAQHRLVRWQPPRRQPDGWRAAVPLGLPLWQSAGLPGTGAADGAADGAPADALRRRMEAAAELDLEDVGLHFGPAGERWSLRALARHDEDGRFTGYIGSALPRRAHDEAAFDQATLGLVWPQARSALLLFRRSGVDWQLAQASSPALGLLAWEPRPGAAPLDWQGVAGRLPPSVGEALGELGAGQSRSLDGWTIQWQPVAAGGDAEAGRLLMLRRDQDEPPEPPTDHAETESFIYSVSHDLRAPIRVVEGFARILKEDYGRALDRIGNDHVDRVLAAAARMNSMIEALLALSRLQTQPLKRQPVDLSQLATYVLEDLRREQPQRQVEQLIEPGLIIQGDPTLIRIAVENLVGNAWKYSAQKPDARIVLRRHVEDGRTVFVVEDNGAGFDMRFADRLFGVFQRLHSAKDFQGTGVGLASVRRILKRHGGDIWASAAVGEGAKFFFTLEAPAQAAPAQRASR